MERDRRLSNHCDRFVRGEIVPIVPQNKQIEGGNEPVRRVAGDQIDLFVLQRAIEQPEVHNSWRLRKAKTVGGGQALVTVRTLHEFVPKASAPVRGISRRLRNCLQMQAARIVSSYLNRKCVIEAQRRTERERKPAFVFRFHLLVHLLLGVLRFFLQNRCQRSARVFGIKVDASREDGLLANERPCQVEAPLDAKAGFTFQALGKNFAEDRLFGEVLRAHHNAVFSRGTTRSQKENRNEQDRKYVAHRLIRLRLVIPSAARRCLCPGPVKNRDSSLRSE